MVNTTEGIMDDVDPLAEFRMSEDEFFRKLSKVSGNLYSLGTGSVLTTWGVRGDVLRKLWASGFLLGHEFNAESDGVRRLYLLGFQRDFVMATGTRLFIDYITVVSRMDHTVGVLRNASFLTAPLSTGPLPGNIAGNTYTMLDFIESDNVGFVMNQYDTQVRPRP